MCFASGRGSERAAAAKGIAFLLCSSWPSLRNEFGGSFATLDKSQG
jgi:hypothetical protein